LRFAPHIGFPDLQQPLFRDSAGSIDPVVQIEYIASLGFAGIEDKWVKKRPVADQLRIGEALARCGLEMGCFVNTVESSRQPLFSSSDPAARDQLERELRDSIETAKRINGKYLTTFASRDPRVPLGFQLAAMVENLKPLAEIAARAGVILCLEQTAEARYPGMLLHRLGDAYGVVKAVASPAARLLFDVLAVQVAEGDLIENLHRTRDAIAVVQVADNPGRTEPGAGELNFVNIFRSLREQGYTGLVEFEFSLSQPGAAGEQRALAALRAINAAV
jgi:hydroxypyruvate isomerase